MALGTVGYIPRRVVINPLCRGRLASRSLERFERRESPAIRLPPLISYLFSFFYGHGRWKLPVQATPCRFGADESVPGICRASGRLEKCTR